MASKLELSGHALSALAGFLSEVNRLANERRGRDVQGLQALGALPQYQINEAPNAERAGFLNRAFGQDYRPSGRYPTVSIAGAPFTLRPTPRMAQTHDNIATDPNLGPAAPYYASALDTPENRQSMLETINENYNTKRQLDERRYGTNMNAAQQGANRLVQLRNADLQAQTSTANTETRERGAMDRTQLQERGATDRTRIQERGRQQRHEEDLTQRQQQQNIDRAQHAADQLLQIYINDERNKSRERAAKTRAEARRASGGKPRRSSDIMRDMSRVQGEIRKALEGDDDLRMRALMLNQNIDDDLKKRAQALGGGDGEKGRETITNVIYLRTELTELANELASDYPRLRGIAAQVRAGQMVPGTEALKNTMPTDTPAPPQTPTPGGAAPGDTTGGGTGKAKILRRLN